MQVPPSVHLTHPVPSRASLSPSAPGSAGDKGQGAQGGHGGPQLSLDVTADPKSLIPVPVAESRRARLAPARSRERCSRQRRCLGAAAAAARRKKAER